MDGDGLDWLRRRLEADKNDVPYVDPEGWVPITAEDFSEIKDAFENYQLDETRTL
jgi:hypothetical protein